MTDTLPRMIPHPISGQMVSFESLYGPEPNKESPPIDESRITDLEDRLLEIEQQLIDINSKLVVQPPIGHII